MHFKNELREEMMNGAEDFQTIDRPIGTARLPGNLANIERGNSVSYRFDSVKQETKRIQRARTIDLNDQQLGEFDFDSILSEIVAESAPFHWSKN